VIYREEIRKYGWIMDNLPTDLTKYVMGFIDPLDTTKKNNYSLDKYIQVSQERQREKIEDFLRELRS